MTTKKLDLNTKKAIMQSLASSLVSRADVMSRIGKTYGGNRDVYEALGYSRSIDFQDYYERWQRQDIAKRIIEAPVFGSWRKLPIIVEDKENETAFEKAYNDLEESVAFYRQAYSADVLAGVGRYGVLLLGFDDGLELSEEATSAKSLLYVKAYSEGTAEVSTWNEDKSNEGYGKPLLYKLTMNVSELASAQSVVVHASRIIHIAEEAYENETYGQPRLKAVYNRLENLELLAGGSAEMFWQGAFPGLHLAADPEARLEGQELEDLEDEIKEYVHGLKRYLRTQGIDIKPLTPQVADPTAHFDLQIKLISAAKGIPTRLLVGSERGELASSQDEKNWNDILMTRRDTFLTPVIIRSFIKRMISVGILPEPKQAYVVEWPDLNVKSTKELAEVGKIKSEALNKYVSSPGADLVIPPEIFMKEFLNMTQEEVDDVAAMVVRAFSSDFGEEETVVEEEE